MQANNVTNGPTIEQQQNMMKPNVQEGQQQQQQQQRPQLIRTDSRSAFPQFRPQFPNQQIGPPRPPQQIRQPPPQQQQQQIINRGPHPGLINRPPGQFNQPRGNFRPLTPFPRPPPPQQQQQQQRPPVVLQQQHSLPQFRPPSTEDLTRSHTVDGSSIVVGNVDNKQQHEDINNKPNLGKIRSFSMVNDEPSSNNNNHHQQQQQQLVNNRRMSKEEIRNGEQQQQQEMPSSRPESRLSTKMNKIIEDEQSSLTDVSQKSIDLSCSTIDTKSGSNNNGVQEVQLQQTTTRPESSKNIKIVNMDEKKDQKPVDLNCPPKAKPKEGDNDSGVDESTQGNDQSSNGDTTRQQRQKSSKMRTSSTTPTKARSLSRGSKSPSLKSPDSTVTTPGSACEKKKVPMNKVQVGAAPSPNLKVVKSKIGSLQNTSYKPGGGKVKIENNKLDFKKVTPRIEAKNDKYMPKGGDKKIQQQKLQWNAKSKIGSLENATYKPGGGEKKIESIKLDFKEKAKPKIGSKDNIKHVPGGGDIKLEEVSDDKKDIENRKIELNVQSKVGSLDNVKHRPGGGDKKIFDDKDYLKQKTSTLNSENHSLSGSQNSLPSQPEVKGAVADENLNRKH